MKPAHLQLSVIVPVRNEPRLLRFAIDSILAQDVPLLDRCEIFVVDDGSTDDTPDVIRSLPGPVTAMRTAGLGPAAARNAALRSARGELIAFLDSDDIWPEGSLAARNDILEKDGRLLAVLGLSQLCSGLSRYPEPLPGSRPVFVYQLGSSLFRREVFERIGHLDESLPAAEDIDFYLKLREQRLPVRLLPVVTNLYRRHDRNLTGERSAVELRVLDAFHRSLVRRRAGHGMERDLAPFERTAAS